MKQEDLLKFNDQDFEWYPTTKEMVAVVYRAMESHLSVNTRFSLLDIGSGDGRVFSFIQEFMETNDRSPKLTDCYAIEKSRILIDAMPKDVCVVGTDFIVQSLIDKRVDCIFCNPPYSDFGQWMVKIIKEANASHIYLVVPQRWVHSEQIEAAIKMRKVTPNVLWSGDFLDGERQARAKVDIVHLNMSGNIHSTYGNQKVDPFDAWFDEYFKIKIGKRDTDGCDDSKEKQDSRHEIIKGKNPIESITQLYQCDLERLLNNYQLLGTLDPELLYELDVGLDGIKKALKMKIAGLKGVYWQELFATLETITKRLITEKREETSRKLRGNMNVDFTADNIYAVVIWVLKNANCFIEEQLLTVYKQMTQEQNVRMYKSNAHMTADSWRYARGSWESKGKPEITRYLLDYRIVLKHYRAIKTRDSYEFEYPNGLHTSAHNYINDIFVVANNLGFNVTDNTMYCEKWEGGVEKAFSYNDNGKTTLFCNIRAYLNGNIHIKFNQKFMKALNVEAGRLLGWLKTPQDAVDEMGLTKADVEKYFCSNLRLYKSNTLLLGN